MTADDANDSLVLAGRGLAARSVAGLGLGLAAVGFARRLVGFER